MASLFRCWWIFRVLEVPPSAWGAEYALVAVGCGCIISVHSFQTACVEYRTGRIGGAQVAFHFQEHLQALYLSIVAYILKAVGIGHGITVILFRITAPE